MAALEGGNEKTSPLTWGGLGGGQPDPGRSRTSLRRNVDPKGPKDSGSPPLKKDSMRIPLKNNTAQATQYEIGRA